MRAFVVYSFVLISIFCKTTSAQDGQFKVVCYYPNWAFYRADPGKYTPENIDPKKCTHINYAFAILDPTSLTIQIQDPNIGGGSDSVAGKYGRLLSDAQARSNFVTTATAFVQKYNFDGLDLDLEVSDHLVLSV